MTEPELIERLEEACGVWARLPDKERRFLRAKWGFWPDIVLSFYEAYGMNATRTRAPIPGPDEIDRANEVMDWMVWLGKTHGRKMMKVVWLCHGQKVKISTICGTMRSHRQTIRKWRDVGTVRLVQYLRVHKKAA